MVAGTAIAPLLFSRNSHRFFMPDRSLLNLRRPGTHSRRSQCCPRMPAVKPDERITIITDEETREIAAALQQEVEEVGSEQSIFVLE